MFLELAERASWMSREEWGSSYFLALSRSHGEMVLSGYRALRDDQLLCDVVLVAEGTEFRAHRSLLASASDYFRSMFKEHTRESKAGVVHLHAVSASGLRRVLDFIYSSCLALSPEGLPQTLETAAYLQVLEAVRLCSRYLVSSLSPGCCCQAANLAARFALAEAQRQAEAYICAHLWRLVAAGAEASGLLELNAESLAAVLEAERLPRLPEEALLGLLLEWLEWEAGRWEQQAAALLPRLRYCLLPRPLLQRLACRPPRPLPPEAQRLLAQALDYHRAESRQPALQSRQSRLRLGEESRLLVVAGGLSLHQGPLATVWALEPRSRQWGPLSSQGPRLRHHCVCVLANFLFVLGGEEAGGEAGDGAQEEEGGPPAIRSQVDRYDPRFGRWSRLASMRSRRAQFSCCVLEDGIVALGGRSGPAASLSAVERYEAGSGSWLRLPGLPHPLHGHASAVHRGTVYVSGGRAGAEGGGSKDMFSFQPPEGRWQRCPPMTIGRFGHQMAAVGERVYCFVGMYEPFCDIECYEPLHRQWQRLRPLLLDRSCYGLAVWDSSVYLVGGKRWHNSREVAAQNAIVYDTLTDSWSEVCKLPLPFCGSQCAVLQLLHPPEPGDITLTGEPLYPPQTGGNTLTGEPLYPPQTGHST
ncbi:kelch-like protein 34 [Mustelus asterias]